MKFWKSHISGIDGSNWFETIAEMNKEIDVKPVNGNMGEKKIYICIFHQAGSIVYSKMF